jgi:hypothetical protein
LKNVGRKLIAPAFALLRRDKDCKLRVAESVGRVTPCAPPPEHTNPGSHGVTSPTVFAKEISPRELNCPLQIEADIISFRFINPFSAPDGTAKPH